MTNVHLYSCVNTECQVLVCVPLCLTLSVCVLASLILSGRGWSVFLCLLNCVSRVEFICVIVSLTLSV